MQTGLDVAAAQRQFVVEIAAHDGRLDRRGSVRVAGKLGEAVQEPRVGMEIEPHHVLRLRAIDSRLGDGGKRRNLDGDGAVGPVDLLCLRPLPGVLHPHLDVLGEAQVRFHLRCVHREREQAGRRDLDLLSDAARAGWKRGVGRGGLDCDPGIARQRSRGNDELHSFQRAALGSGKLAALRPDGCLHVLDRLRAAAVSVASAAASGSEKDGGEVRCTKDEAVRRNRDPGHEIAPFLGMDELLDHPFRGGGKRFNDGHGVEVV